MNRGGGGGIPLHKPYRYVLPQRIGFLGLFGLRMGIDKFCPFWSGIRYGFEGTMGVYERINLLFQREKGKYVNSKWI